MSVDLATVKRVARLARIHLSDAEAEKHWFDMRHATNGDALKHMGKWTENAAWRKWGASGRVTGPRRKLPAKRRR